MNHLISNGPLQSKFTSEAEDWSSFGGFAKLRIQHGLP